MNFQNSIDLVDLSGTVYSGTQGPLVQGVHGHPFNHPETGVPQTDACDPRTHGASLSPGVFVRKDPDGISVTGETHCTEEHEEDDMGPLRTGAHTVAQVGL